MKSNSKMILLIRTIHGIITFIFLSCIIYIYYAGINNQKTILAYIAVGMILLEGIIVSFNKGDCPLGVVHQKFGDDKAFFELFLPKQIAKKTVPFLGIIAFIGFLILVF